MRLIRGTSLNASCQMRTPSTSPCPFPSPYLRVPIRPIYRLPSSTAICTVVDFETFGPRIFMPLCLDAVHKMISGQVNLYPLILVQQVSRPRVVLIQATVLRSPTSRDKI